MKTKVILVSAILVFSACGQPPERAASYPKPATVSVTAKCVKTSSARGVSGGGALSWLEHEDCEKLQARVLQECPKNGSNFWGTIESEDCPRLYN